MGKRRFTNRIFSLFLSFALCLPALPLQAMAEEDSSEDVVSSVEAVEATDDEGGLYALEPPTPGKAFRVASSRSGFESAWFPAPRMLLTQVAYENASHGNCNAIDISPGGNVFAPFTGVIKQTSPNWGYVLFQSLDKVYFADGSLDYMTVGFMHDSNISDLYVGQVISQGTDFYQAGGMGDGNPKKYADHVDISVFRGQVNHVNSGFGKGDTFAYNAFLINKNKTIINGSSNFGFAQQSVNYNSAKNWSNLWRYLDQTSSPTVVPIIQAWLSASEMGEKIDYSNPDAFRQGGNYYFCYKITDRDSGKLLNALGTHDYTVRLEAYNPDGSMQHSYSFTNQDNSWISFPAKYCGTYVFRCSIMGKIDGYGDISYSNAAQLKSTPETVNLGSDFYAYIHYPHGGDLNLANHDKNAVVVAKSMGDPRQIWHFIWDNSKNAYKVVNMYDGLCLDLSKGKLEPDNNVGLVGDNGDIAQRWKIATGAFSGVNLLMPAGSNDFALDVYETATQAGANVQIWNTTGKEAQTFAIYKYTADEIKRELAFDAGKDFYAQVSFNGMYLQTTGTRINASGGGKGMDVCATLTSNPADPRQIWHFIQQSDGSYKIINQYTNWCLDVAGGVAQNRQNVWTWHEDHGNPPERWYVMNSTGENRFRISTALSFPQKMYSLDIPGGEKLEGAKVEIYAQNANPQQQFTITKLPDYKPKSYLLGDINQNGSVDQIDLNQIMKYISGLYQPENAALFQMAADMNCDGNIDEQDRDAVVQLIIETSESKERYGSCRYGSCGKNVYWRLVDGVLTIRGSGEMYNYSLENYADSAPWRNSAEDILAVTIEEGITCIGKHAFSQCSKLNNVTIPNGVTSIRDSAFASCNGLKKVSYAGNEENWRLISIDVKNDPLKNATIYCNGQQLPTTVPVSGITLNKMTLNLAAGKSDTLTAAVSPLNATNQTVSWSSSKPSVASVSNGKVTAVKAGTAVITATTADGRKTATCTVTVSKTLIGISVTKKPDKLTYAYGEKLSTAGMEVSTLYDDGSAAVVSGWAVSGYDPNLSGTQTVSVRYQGFTAVFTVTVSDYVVPGNVAKPQISIESFIGGKRVILTSSTSNAQIHYTTDGSIPTTGSPLYNGQPIELTATKTVKAIATLNGVASSVTSSKIAVFQASAPVAYPSSGKVKEGTIVTLRSDTTGSMIYYTLNGTYPEFDRNGNCKAGTYLYGGAVVLHGNTQLWAVAVKDGFCNSGIAKAQYTVEGAQRPVNEVIVSLGSVSTDAGVVASVPVCLFSNSDISSFHITLSFDKDAFENYVTVSPAEGVDPAELFTSVNGGKVSILYTGKPIEGGEVCTLNFTSLVSQADTTHQIVVDLTNSAVSTGVGTDVELSAMNGNIKLGKARIPQINGEVTYTKPNGSNIQSIGQTVGEKEIEASVSIGEAINVAANVYLVIYDRNERMVSTDTWKVDLSDPAFMFVQTIKIPQNIQVGAIKIMILSDQMVPLMAASELAN